MGFTLCDHDAGSCDPSGCVTCYNKVRKVQRMSLKSPWKLQVHRLQPDAKLPTRNYTWDAGIDLYALKDTLLPIGFTTRVETGIAVNIPKGYVGLIKDRSSMALKGLRVGGGVIDCQFAGPCDVILHNLNNRSTDILGSLAGYEVKAGDRIAQLVIQRVELPEIEEVNEIWSSERGTNGYGSSGK